MSGEAQTRQPGHGEQEQERQRREQGIILRHAEQDGGATKDAGYDAQPVAA